MNNSCDFEIQNKKNKLEEQINQLETNCCDNSCEFWKFYEEKYGIKCCDDVEIECLIWEFYEKKYGIKIDIEFLEDHKDETIQNEYDRRMNNGLLAKEIYEYMSINDVEKEKINDTKQHITRFTYNGLIYELNRRKLQYRKFGY